MRKLLLLLLVSGLGGVALAQTDAKAPMRGAQDDAGFEAAERSVQNQLMVEEMEDAGFEIDVLEGFDEEWEEDVWVSSEADDVSANYVDPTDAARFDMDEVPHADDVDAGWSEDAWENPEQVLDGNLSPAIAVEDADDADLGTMRGEAASDDLLEEDAAIDADLAWEEEDEPAEEESAWWEESSENYTAFIEDMDELDMDEFEEEEDLDLLEELYMAN